VAIGVGPTDSVLWIGAYIPHRNGREEGTGLRVKLREWYRLNMTAPNVDGEEREVDKSFNVLDWLWNTPLANRIARAELNPLIKGVILTGDLNQRYESGAKGKRALAVRTETMGLTFSLAERFQELRCNYPTYGWAHKGGGPHIDHVFTSLPPESIVAGGTPSDPVWGSVSDHLPVCASFFLPEIRETERRGRKRTYKAKPNPSFRIKDKKDEEKKKAAFAVEWAKRRKGLKVHPAAGEAISPEADSLMLEFLCRQAVDIVEEIAPPPKQPKGKPRATGSAILHSARALYQQLTLLHRAWGKEGRFKKNTNMGTRDKARATAQSFKSWAKAETKTWAKATEDDPRPTVLEWGTAHPRKW
jgi:hypothetical protein